MSDFKRFQVILSDSWNTHTIYITHIIYITRILKLTFKTYKKTNKMFFIYKLFFVNFFSMYKLLSKTNKNIFYKFFSINKNAE